MQEPVDLAIRAREEGRTEGGEALSMIVAAQQVRPAWQTDHQQDEEEEIRGAAGSRWYVLWTRSHCEQLVHEQLAAKGFHLFLPRIEVWSRRGGLRHRIPVPMFPGYLFLRHAMDKTSFIEVHKARGLVRILGERWDRLAVAPDSEIEAVQRVLAARLRALPHPYLREGQRVRISHGPLAGVEGILVQIKPNKGFLVLSVNILQRSVAVEVDCTWVTAA